MMEKVRIGMYGHLLAMRAPFDRAVIYWMHIHRFDELVGENNITRNVLKMWKEWMDTQGYSAGDKMEYATLIKLYIMEQIKSGTPPEFFVNFL